LSFVLAIRMVMRQRCQSQTLRPTGSGRVPLSSSRSQMGKERGSGVKSGRQEQQREQCGRTPGSVHHWSQSLLEPQTRRKESAAIISAGRPLHAHASCCYRWHASTAERTDAGDTLAAEVLEASTEALLLGLLVAGSDPLALLEAVGEPLIVAMTLLDELWEGDGGGLELCKSPAATHRAQAAIKRARELTATNATAVSRVESHQQPLKGIRRRTYQRGRNARARRRRHGRGHGRRYAHGGSTRPGHTAGYRCA